MALFHLSAKAVSRSTGRSAVGAAAYRSGERLTNERDGVTHDYTRKRGVLSSFIVAPAGAEAWASDRSGLWNRAEAAEARKDAKVAREYELALPAELSDQEREALARQFAQAVVERFGVVADVALHEPHREGDQRNWHAHILTTTRAANENGLGAKTRVLDSPRTSAAEIEALRELWAKQVNAALERAQAKERVDHRSYARQDAAQGRDPRDRIKPPGVHLGPAATALERRAARKRVRELGDDAGLMERHRAKQLQGASHRDAMRSERAARHLEVAQARHAAREAESKVVQLEAERERRRAAEIERRRLEAVWNRERQAAEPKPRRPEKPISVKAETPGQARSRRWQAMSVADLRAEIERIQPAWVSQRPGMAEASDAREAAESVYKRAQEALRAKQGELQKLIEQGAEWRSQHPILNWLHQVGLREDRQYGAWQRQAETLLDEIPKAQQAHDEAKAARDEAVQAEEALAAQHRADREREMKALEPDLKVLKDLLAERQEEARQAERTPAREQERDRGDEMEMGL